MNRMGRMPVLLAGGVLSLCAQAVEVSGVPYADTTTVGGSRLVLNGAGTRFKAVFKVYTAGLYVARKTAQVDELLLQEGPKRIALTMLRDIDAEELGRLFIKGIKANTPNEEYGRILGSVLRMSQVFTDFKRLKAGQTITMDWLPGTGTTITVAGKTVGTPFQEPEFYRAMLRIWLGPDPADWQLKDQLLGLDARRAS